MKKLRYIILSGLVGLILLGGCKPFDLTQEDLTLSFDVSIFDGYVNVIYYDAATGIPLGLEEDPDIQVKINCNYEDVIMNPDAEYQSEYDLKQGFFSFALNPYGVQPTVDNPITITIESLAPGFMDHYKTITLTDAITYNFDLNLINTEVPPDGVNIEGNEDVGETSDNGEIQEDILLETEDDDVQVTIESGAILTDDEGTPLQGAISVEITSVDVEDKEGLKNLPGLNQPLITEDGTESTLSTPLAYTKVSIRDESGRKASSVKGEDLIIKSSFPGGIIHPTTGQEIKSGDEVPSYGFNTETSTWAYMGPDPVVDEDGVLYLVKTIKSMKSGLATNAETGNISDITYSFDEEAPVDLAILFKVPEDILPTKISMEITDADGGAISLPSHEMLITKEETTIRFNNLASSASFDVTISFNQYPTLSVSGTASTSSDLAEVTLDASGLSFESGGGGAVTNFIVDFKFTCTSSTGQGVNQQGNGVSFTLTFREVGTSTIKILQVENGTFEVDFNPASGTAPTFEARIYRGDFVYPTGGEWEPIIKANFTPAGATGSHFLYHHQPSDSPTRTKEQKCDDFISIFGL
ncbi:MAG: hypothetical protein KAH17_05725 [Bacteroidales bacterium]|nr:hypothetical protein [Bacteroidales bacterium]